MFYFILLYIVFILERRRRNMRMRMNGGNFLFMSVSLFSSHFLSLSFLCKNSYLLSAFYIYFYIFKVVPEAVVVRAAAPPNPDSLGPESQPLGPDLTNLHPDVIGITTITNSSSSSSSSYNNPDLP